MNSKYAVAIIFTLLILVACGTSVKPTAVWDPAKTTHTISASSHLSPLWQRSIYTATDISGNPCTAINGLLFLIGSESAQGNLHILAIDEDGKTKWSQEGDFSLTLTHSSTQLFIGNGRTITSLAPENGDINWSTDIPATGSVIELFYFDNQLFVSASSDPYFVISPNDGKIIAKYSSVVGFRGDYPHLPFFANVNFQPIILGNEAIFQLGDGLYTFERNSITTNDPVWEIEQDSISNSTLIGDQLFYVAKDDKLKAINASTGELLYETTIAPSIDFFNYEKKDVQHVGYYVCSDMENRVLYVILGDSRQLFAFSVAD